MYNLQKIKNPCFFDDWHLLVLVLLPETSEKSCFLCHLYITACPHWRSLAQMSQHKWLRMILLFSLQSESSRLCLKNVKMIWDRNFKIQIFTACILEFVFSDCLLQETIIDNCNKLCSVESILETLCGMVTMQWRFLPFWRGCLKI